MLQQEKHGRGRDVSAASVRAPLIDRRVAAALVALVAITVLVYAPVRSFAFVSIDDELYVTDNPFLRLGLSWATIARALSSTYANFWHPLTVLSLMLDARLFGVRAGPMHVTSLALHTASTLLLFLTLYRATGARRRSALVAALFAVHPLHVESVAWVSERKDVLSTVFWMLTLWAYLSYTRVPGWRRYASALGVFALGLMAKPMLVTLPLVLLLLDVWPLGRTPLWRDPDPLQDARTQTRPWRALILEKVPFLTLSLVASLVAFVAQREGGAIASLEGFSLTARLANAPIAYLAYLDRMLWPRRLTVFYPYPLQPRLVAAAAASVVLVGITIVAVRWLARRPYLAVGWLWYVVTLLPVIGLVQVGSHAMADRYTYVPLIGPFIAIVWLAGDFVSTARAWRPVPGIAACGVVAALMLVGRPQVMTWRNSGTLWRHAVEVAPDNYFAHNALGLELEREGRVEAALVHYRISARLAPGFPNPQNNIGLVLEGQGRIAEAVEQYREALRRAPEYQTARVNLGNALVKAGRANEAIPEYEAALAAGWHEGRTRANFATALAEAGRYDEAIRQFDEAVRRDPESARTRYNYGNLLQRVGRSAAAIDQYREALRLGPASADVHENLGIALEHAGRSADAIDQFEDAVRLAPGNAATRLNLGNALLTGGRAQDAAEQFRTVLRSAPANVEAHIGLGTALFDAGHVAEALAEHRMAVALGPNVADAHFNLAATLQRAGRLSEAAAEFERTARLEGATPDVHLSLGVLYEQLGRFGESAAHYSEALRLQPGLASASAGLVRVRKVAQR